MDAQTLAAAAAKFPPGYLEDYNGHKLVATCISCIVLNIFFVFARFISRWLHNTPRGWDDFLMVPALMFSVLLAAQGLGMFCFLFLFLQTLFILESMNE